MAQITPRSRRESGQTLVLFVLALSVLVGFAAITIDVGLFLHQRRSLQNAADAAALAGAEELPDNPSTAVAKAQEWAAMNGIDVANGELESVTVSTTSFPNDTLEMKVRRNSSFVFGQVLGLTSTDVSAAATARKGSPRGMARFAPLAVQSTTFEGLEPGDMATLKYDAHDQTKGNSLALAFTGDTGGSDFKDSIISGAADTLCVAGQEYAGCPSVISTEPGNMVGPVRQGIDWLISHTGSNCDQFEEVFVLTSGGYKINSDCNPFESRLDGGSNRVIIVPVIDELCGGRCDTQIVRFSLFFLEGIHCTGSGAGSCSITGRYAEASYDAGSLALGPLDPGSGVNFVRLIR